MPTNDYSKNIVYLSKEQYQELITNETLTVNGQTITYNDNDIYVTPQAEPITDVKINGTSIGSNGVANIPIMDRTTLGVAKIQDANGIIVDNGGYLRIAYSSSDIIKRSTGQASLYQPIVPYYQHESVFYGLAKAASDTTQSISTNAVGTYTSEAKAAIQSMLDVPSKADVANLIAVSTTAPSESEAKIWIDTDDSTTVQVPTVSEMNLALATKVGDVQVNGSSVVSNGVANIPVASSSTFGVVKSNGIYGVSIWGGTTAGTIALVPASESEIKSGNQDYHPITASTQYKATFYGLAKAAGDETQSVSTNAVGTYTSDASAAIRNMLGAVGDVQANGTSVVSNGVANIPACTTSTYGVVKPHTNSFTFYDGALRPRFSSVSDVKGGSDAWKPLHADLQHAIAFYGLARAAGDATQSASSNAVGTYTTEAKAAIQSMLGIDLASIAAQVDIPLVETVEGTTPSITGQPNVRYVCGEVSTLSITPPARGSMDVIFESGSTAAVLTVPNTVKWPVWFDATALETDTTYEILITDGVYGSVMTWAT